MRLRGARRGSIATAAVAASLLAVVAATGAGAQDAGEPAPDPGEAPAGPTLPGEEQLRNLEHVYNFNPKEHDPQRDRQSDERLGETPPAGSDLEFFTHPVPLRDYETGDLVDGRGEPLPPGSEPVVAERDFAVVGSPQRGAYVFDITDPEAPQLVTRVTCRQARNDVGVTKLTGDDGETRVVLALTRQTGVPCGEEGDVGMRVDAPEARRGFVRAAHWIGTANVSGQRGELAYAGTGCTPVQYQGVEGRIALVDEFENADGEVECPIYTPAQKMAAAQQGGAVGLVQVSDDDERTPANAGQSDIPGLEVARSDGAPIRDAVAGGATVEVTLTTGESDVPVRGEGSGGVGVFDITDPFEWRPMYRLRTGFGGVHNFAFHPTAPVGYAWNGALPGGVNTIPIVDFRELDDPVVREGPTTLGGPHDGELTPDGDRMYVASENNYQIYDTTDPLEPTRVSAAVNAGSYAHGVFPTSDGELMVGNNESLLLGGLLVPGTALCPGEGLAAYDLRNEGAPVGPLGQYVPDVVGPSEEICTSHFGRFVPGTRVMSIGWYAAGVRVVDWSQPSAPREVAGAVLEGTNTWAAKIHTGPYVYAGDIGRGFDVFRWAGDGPAPWLAGEPDDEAPADDARGTVEVEVEADAGCEACPVNPEADVRVEVPPDRASPEPDRATPAHDAAARRLRAVRAGALRPARAGAGLPALPVAGAGRRRCRRGAVTRRAGAHRSGSTRTSMSGVTGRSVSAIARSTSAARASGSASPLA